MEAFITALTTEIDATALWGVLAMIVPFVGVVLLFAIGLHFIRRAVAGAGKGKAKF